MIAKKTAETMVELVKPRLIASNGYSVSRRTRTFLLAQRPMSMAPPATSSGKSIPAKPAATNPRSIAAIIVTV